MTSVADIERAAARLRQQLRAAGTPELRLLCGLQFFGLLASDTPALESYLREFIPAMATSARKSSGREFLPNERAALQRLVDLLNSQSSQVIAPDDLQALRRLSELGSVQLDTTARPSKHSAHVRCLFVEHYPDLGLAPRGRILNLTVTVTLISPRSESDDIVVRNPVSEPDDRFLAQARDSISAARAYLHKHYGLSPKKRYRFDFAVDSTGARFTGDSLGAAFAAGAVAAVTRHEVFRERLDIAPSAAITSALTSDGRLGPIDAEALKLKIYRAFHSDLEVLAIPREHIKDAWAYLAALEQESPGRKLELLGADTLDDVISDPRLLPVERFSTPAHIARLAWKAKRSVWVELPVALVLVAVALVLVLPARCKPWQNNPAYVVMNTTTDRYSVFNRDSVLLWDVSYGCELVHCDGQRAADIDGDGKNEVLVIINSSGGNIERGWLYCYNADGTLRFKRYCPIQGKYPGDTAGVLYEAEHVDVALINDERYIVTDVFQSSPARAHIRIWSADGDSLGWYINAGGSDYWMTADVDADGSEELVLSGFNNRLQSVALFALRPDSSHGVSPPYESPDYDLTWVEPGNQAAYIIFPVSDVALHDLPTNYNQPFDLRASESMANTIEFHIRESVIRDTLDNPPCLIYSLRVIDGLLRVVRVVPNDQFYKRRSDLSSPDALGPVGDWQAYLRDALAGIRYQEDLSSVR